MDRPDVSILVPDESPGPQSMVLAAELRRQLSRLIRSLPAKLRDPLLLIASGECSYEEAAAILRVVQANSLRRTAAMLTSRSVLDQGDAANLVRQHLWYDEPTKRCTRPRKRGAIESFITTGSMPSRSRRV